MTKEHKSADDLEGLYNAAPFSSVLVPGSAQNKNAISNAKAKAYAEKSRAKEFTTKQVRYLSYLLGYEPSNSGLESYVRYANGYYQGTLTRVHWLQAIALAKDGHNWYGNHVSLIKLSYEDTL